MMRGKVDGYFNELNTLIAKHADLSEMEPALDDIVGKLESGFKIEQTEETKLGGWEYIDQINKLLDQSTTEYKAGNFEDARAHPREASSKTMKTSKATLQQTTWIL